jgi:hypothetical protein
VACQLWPPDGTRTGRDCLARLLFEDVVAIGRPAGLHVNRRPDVLEDRFLHVEEFARDAIQLPHQAGFTDGHERLLLTVIDQRALEHLVEIERFSRRV